MVGDLFLQGPRTDLTARLHNEPAYDFLNRSADPFIDDIRQLMAEWLSHVSSEHADELRRRLQSKDDEQFESAFWELYLHEACLRSGYGLTIHPEVAGTSRHPDFLVEGDGARFYLEAVRACPSAASVGEEKRLEDARRVLATLGADHYFLDMAIYAIGTRSLRAKGFGMTGGRGSQASTRPMAILQLEPVPVLSIACPGARRMAGGWSSPPSDSSPSTLRLATRSSARTCTRAGDTTRPGSWPHWTRRRTDTASWTLPLLSPS
jgi:hypothetical protein